MLEILSFILKIYQIYVLEKCYVFSILLAITKLQIHTDAIFKDLSSIGTLRVVKLIHTLAMVNNKSKWSKLTNINTM